MSDLPHGRTVGVYGLRNSRRVTIVGHFCILQIKSVVSIEAYSAVVEIFFANISDDCLAQSTNELFIG